MSKIIRNIPDGLEASYENFPDAVRYVDTIADLANVDTEFRDAGGIVVAQGKQGAGMPFVYTGESDDGGVVINGWKRIFDGKSINVVWFGALGLGADYTDEFTNAENYIAQKNGGTIYVPDGQYIKSRTFPPSNTFYIFHPNAEMIQNDTNLWRISNADNVHFIGNGCKFTGDLNGTQSVFQFSQARKSSIYNVKIYGAGLGEDGIYIGGNAVGAGEYSQDIFVEKVTIDGNTGMRNCISVVDARDVTIRNCELSGASGSPGSGIDVESNVFDQAQDILIDNCRIHDNSNAGITVTFGEKVKIKNCKIKHNALGAISCGAGGYQYQAGVYRPEDFRGITNFDVDTGKITLSSVDKLEVGAFTQFVIKNDATLPPELNPSTRYAVTFIDKTTNEIVLGGVFGQEGQPFSDAGTGNLDPDPAISDIALKTFVEGQCSDITIEGCETIGGIGFSAGAVNFTVKNCNILVDGSGSMISASYTNKAYIYNNTVKIINNIGTSAGISTVGSNIIIAKNTIRNSNGRGISAYGNNLIIQNNTLIACGKNYATGIQANNSYGVRIKENTIIEEGVKLSTGIFAHSSCTSGIISDNYVVGVATSNSTAIASAYCTKVNNINHDGTVS